MDHEASYIMTRATVVAEVTHRGQVGVSHINMSSHGGYGWEEMTCTALYTKVMVVGSNKEILVGGLEGGCFTRGIFRNRCLLLL